MSVLKKMETDRPATSAEAKRYWEKGGVKSILTGEARRDFGKGSRWTVTRGGHPAIVSSSGQFIVAFAKDERGQVHAIDVGGAEEAVWQRAWEGFGR